MESTLLAKTRKIPLFILTCVVLGRIPTRNDFQKIVVKKELIWHCKNTLRNTETFTLRELFNLALESESQFGQDLFVISIYGKHKNRFAIEFGAANGIDLSNTFLLEKFLGWNCLLIEPCKIYHRSLELNRPNSILEYCAVAPGSNGPKIFFERENSGLSSLQERKSSNSEINKDSLSYYVDTSTLQDILQRHQLSHTIDFLSIDIEGLEFEILASLNYSEISIGVICVEHNFRDDREKIHKLLSDNGFTRYLEEYSNVDDWYVSNDLNTKLILS